VKENADAKEFLHGVHRFLVASSSIISERFSKSARLQNHCAEPGPSAVARWAADRE
jgi:hypothetical protein